MRHSFKCFRNRQQGLTLVELMVVIVVIGVISGIAIVTYTNALDRARQRATMADMRNIAVAIEAYSVDHDHVPDDSGGWALLVASLDRYAKGNLPYEDHWGNALGYDREGPADYSLFSFGKDGLDGDDYKTALKADFTVDLVLSNGNFVAAPH